MVVPPLTSRTSNVTSRNAERRLVTTLTARTSTRSLGDSRTSIGPFPFLIPTVDPAGSALDQIKLASSGDVACAAATPDNERASTRAPAAARRERFMKKLPCGRSGDSDTLSELRVPDDFDSPRCSEV